MNQLVTLSPALPLPAIVTASGDQAKIRFLEFFAASIRNPNTRRGYGRAVAEFLAWCETRNVRALGDIQPLHVAAYVEALSKTCGALPRLSSVRQRIPNRIVVPPNL